VSTDTAFSLADDNHMTISEDQIRKAIESYVRCDSAATDTTRSANISAIEQFISRKEQSYHEMEARSRAPVTLDSEDRLSCRVYHDIAQIKMWIFGINERIYAIQLKHLSRLIVLAKEIRDYVCNTPQTIGECDGLEAEMRRDIRADVCYEKLRVHRHALLTKARGMICVNMRMEPLALLQTEVLAAIAVYDAQVNYSMPCRFDEILVDYIRSCPELSGMVNPAAAVIAEGTPMALLSTLSEFNLAMMSRLKINSEPARAVVYTALVRFLFGVGYTLNHAQLMGSDKENCAFLKACEKFSEQTVRELVLTKVITQNYTPGLTVASLFKSRQVDMLKPMEAMSNPIDLMHYVHDTLGKLATYFASSEQFLSFDDILTLLLALMSLSPPANAIAIGAFVTKWDSVQLSDMVSIAKNYFVAAVEQILIYGQEHI
jgi:hypothetical protein